MNPWETPIHKSGCGVLGILRKSGAGKIPSEQALTAIECVRYRGSRLGAGFASIDLDRGGSAFKVKAFVDSMETAELVDKLLSERQGIRIVERGYEDYDPGRRFNTWVTWVRGEADTVSQAVSEINQVLWGERIRGRIYSWGRFVDVFKGVGYPRDVAESCMLAKGGVEADLWIAHTRQPTNSPGIYPVWSHPFSSHEWAVVHNGDISSFGANMEFLLMSGVRSFVGTDSEVIAYLLDHLTRREGLGIEEAAQLLCNPYDNLCPPHIRRLITRYRGAQLDGPFTVVAGYSDGRDVYLLALTDRSKFRPIVVGEDEERFYVASEEAQIRALSPGARVWTVEPGRYFLASLRRGLIDPGRDSLVAAPYLGNDGWDGGIDAEGMDYRRLNDEIRRRVEAGERRIKVFNVRGQRYLGVGLPPGVKLEIHGVPGNCLGNFNEGVEIEVYGNAQDDVGDTMHAGRIIIHGDARDVIGQALQGGMILVKGNVGNRAAIQMREYMDRRPYLIVGGRADDYFGEYMAGGVAVILGLGVKGEPVGKHVATGMVGGRIYIRGRISEEKVGLQPPRQDVERYLKGLLKEGLITPQTYQKRIEEGASFKAVERHLTGKPLKRIWRLFENKHTKQLEIEYRKLTSEDIELIKPALTEFWKTFNLPPNLLQQTLNQEYTIIHPR